MFGIPSVKKGGPDALRHVTRRAITKKTIVNPNDNSVARNKTGTSLN